MPNCHKLAVTKWQRYERTTTETRFRNLAQNCGGFD